MRRGREAKPVRTLLDRRAIELWPPLASNRDVPTERIVDLGVGVASQRRANEAIHPLAGSNRDSIVKSDINRRKPRETTSDRQ